MKQLLLLYFCVLLRWSQVSFLKRFAILLSGTRRNSERAESLDDVELERISAAAELSHNMGTDGDIFCFDLSRNTMTENMDGVGPSHDMGCRH